MTMVALMESHPFQLIDVFTDRPLAGNQLAVFREAQRIPEQLLGAIAREMNLAETVFIYPSEEGLTARIRIFTTWCEVDFAGHPVLGTACLLAKDETQGDGFATITLETKREPVAIDASCAPGGSLSGWMKQPLPTISKWDGDLDSIVSILGIKPALPVELYNNGIPHLYIGVDSVDDVLAIEPDFAALRNYSAGVRINCFAVNGKKVTTRMFSPFDPSQPEDPATGSAAGPLAAHLVRHDLLASGDEITISQGEKVGRPSTLLASATWDGMELTALRVGGSACPVGKGQLTL